VYRIQFGNFVTLKRLKMNLMTFWLRYCLTMTVNRLAVQVQHSVALLWASSLDSLIATQCIHPCPLNAKLFLLLKSSLATALTTTTSVFVADKWHV
jgi:hypothetical protein